MPDVVTIKGPGGESYRITSPGAGRVGSKLARCEPYERLLLQDIYRLRESGTAFDIGAHIGNHTLWLAAACGFAVHAWEPYDQSRAMLEENIVLNPELDVTVHSWAAGATSTVGRFTSGRWIEFDPTRSGAELRVGQGDVTVQRIDDHLEVDDLAVVKVDVEGMEADVLAGCVEHIRRCRPVIYCEAHTDESTESVGDVIGPLGYTADKTIQMGSPMQRWVPRRGNPTNDRKVNLMPKAPYQDVWRDGALVTKGRRECADRFANIADRVGSPETVVDVGGWDGYFARRFAESGASVELVEPRNVPDLPAGVEHRQERVDGSTRFDRCDVALVLSVLHHIDDWRQVIDNLRRSCGVLIVETPHPDELDGELSPTLVETGPRIGPLHEHLLGIGDVFATTPGPNGVRRPIAAIDNSIEGTVEDGVGRAVDAMASHDADVWEPLGYVPEPGTLNVKVGQTARAWSRDIPGAVSLGGGDTSTLGTHWPVTILSGADAVDGPLRHSRSRTTVECVSPVNLREALDLADGDTVTIRIR